MQKTFINELGERHGFLSVVQLLKRGKGGTLWLCKCDCGNFTVVRGNNLRSGDTKSCGCLNIKRAKAQLIAYNTIDNRTKHPLYPTWKTMLARCENPKNTKYFNYGGRGIYVCPEWHDFWTFVKDMGPKLSIKYSINRIINDGPYCKNNCEWASALTQAKNKRKYTRHKK